MTEEIFTAMQTRQAILTVSRKQDEYKLSHRSIGKTYREVKKECLKIEIKIEKR